MRSFLIYPEDVNSCLAPRGTSKRAVSGEAWAACLCGELTFGVLAYSKSPTFPSRCLLLSSPFTIAVLSALGLLFGSACPSQSRRKGFDAEKSPLMLNQEDLTFLRGIFNV